VGHGARGEHSGAGGAMSESKCTKQSVKAPFCSRQLDDDPLMVSLGQTHQLRASFPCTSLLQRHEKYYLPLFFTVQLK